MLIKEKIGNINFFARHNRKIDYLLLEWYETNKRIMHKKTVAGLEVVIKFLNESQQLTEGDVLYEDDFNVIVVEVKECAALAVRPRSMFEMASLCYEIGNRHIPAFYQQDEILVAFEVPFHQLLQAAGYDVNKADRKLVHPLKTSVLPHGQSSQSLFSKIMKLSNPPQG